MTRGSGRRCVTPDPMNSRQERTLLVLDLRRSHSQDTLSWYGVSMPPMTTVEPPTRTSTPVQTSQSSPVSQRRKLAVKKKAGTSPKPEDHDKGASQKVYLQYISFFELLPLLTPGP